MIGWIIIIIIIIIIVIMIVIITIIIIVIMIVIITLIIIIIIIIACRYPLFVVFGRYESRGAVLTGVLPADLYRATSQKVRVLIGFTGA